MNGVKTRMGFGFERKKTNFQVMVLRFSNQTKVNLSRRNSDHIQCVFCSWRTERYSECGLLKVCGHSGKLGTSKYIV